MTQNFLLQNVEMDTETQFLVNGDINIYPCAYEQDREPLTSKKRVSYRGRITVMEDGNASVRAYRVGSTGPQYRKLYETEHCQVLMTQRGVLIERWRFDRKLNIHAVCNIRKRETPMVMAFYQTLK